MSLAQLKDHAGHLSAAEQRELIAFLISRQTEQDDDFRRALAAKIDDQNPDRWVALEALSGRSKG